MKYLSSILSIFVAVFCLTACDNDSVNDLQGVYNDMTICNTKEATVQPTTKLGKGIKSLNINFKDSNGKSIAIGFRSNEWILANGTYTVSNDIADKKCTVCVDNESMTTGDADVSLIDGKYYINALFANAEGKKVKLTYCGELSFEVGEDDPEASGYTLAIATNPVADWSTDTPVFYPDVTQYAITINNPTGAPVVYLEAVNANNLGAINLVGDYTIQGSPTQPWLIGNGYCFPQWGVAGGSYYVDDAGNKQYLASGKITITTAKDSEGNDLYSFSASDLGTTDAAGNAGTGGSFNIKFASLLNN